MDEIKKNALGFVTREPKKDSEGRIIGGYNFYHYHMGCHKNETLDNVFTESWLKDRKKRLEAKGRDPRLFCSRCGEEIKIE